MALDKLSTEQLEAHLADLIIREERARIAFAKSRSSKASATYLRLRREVSESRTALRLRSVS